MSTLPAGWSDALDIASDAIVIVDPEGAIVASNRAAEPVIGGQTVGTSLCERLRGGSDAFLRATALSRRMSGHVPIVLELRDEPGDQTTSIHGACKRLGKGRSCEGFALRLSSPAHDRFHTLTAKIDALNAEIRERIEAQKAAETALAQNELLMHELQHRVKNNAHILGSLLRRQASKAGNPEFRELVERATQRLFAMTAANDMMYRDEGLESVDARRFFETLVGQVSESLLPDGEIVLELGASWQIPNNHVTPLALIVNEAITNSVKYGRADEDGLTVSIDAADGARTLTIRDRGPGFQDGQSRTGGEGTGLIDRLAKQIGAEISRYNENGAVLKVVFDQP